MRGENLFTGRLSDIYIAQNLEGLKMMIQKQVKNDLVPSMTAPPISASFCTAMCRNAV